MDTGAVVEQVFPSSTQEGSAMNFSSQFSNSQFSSSGYFYTVSQLFRLLRFDGLLLLVAMLPLQEVLAQSSIEELPPPAGINSAGSTSDPTFDGTKSILEQTSSVSSSDPAGLQLEVEQYGASGEQRPGDVPPPPMPMKDPAGNPNDSPNSGMEDRRELDSGKEYSGKEYSGKEYEVLMQGPVHEAFAIPEQVDAFSNQVIPYAPPAPINEQPPALPQVYAAAATAANKLQWIGGYWAFREEVGDYVWVSGLYREVPPDRVWVPGTWMQTDGGYQWVQGYWESEALAEQTAFLPAPPASIDNGPSSPPPNDQSFWMPGQWNYVGNEYQWQSGYWTAQYADWVWQPACYQSTPQGYIYVSGYWDYEPIHRGIVYAPIVFLQPVYLAPGYHYRPGYPIANPSSLLLHLFVRSGHRHYYYGDFYGDRYARLGYQPWYRSSLPGFHSASLLSHYQWKYQRQGIAFVDSMARYDNYFRTNPIAHSSLAGTLPTLRFAANSLPSASPFGNSFDAIVRSSAVGSPVRVTSNRAVTGSVASSSASALNRVSTTQDALRSLSRTAVPNLALPGGQRQDNAFSNLVPQGLSPGSSATPAPRSGFGPAIREQRPGFSALPPGLSTRSGTPLGNPRGFSPPGFGPPGFNRAEDSSAAVRLRSSLPSFSPPGFTLPNFPSPGMGRSTIGPPSFSPRASDSRAGGLGQGGSGFGGLGAGRSGIGGRRK